MPPWKLLYHTHTHSPPPSLPPPKICSILLLPTFTPSKKISFVSLRPFFAEWCDANDRVAGKTPGQVVSSRDDAFLTMETSLCKFRGGRGSRRAG